MKKAVIIALGTVALVLFTAFLATWWWLRADLRRIEEMVVSAERRPVPARVLDAIVAVEDPHFLERKPRLMIRRLIFTGVGCGPTLTLRLVRLADDRPERPLLRFLRRNFLCAMVELRYTPVQIAQAYAQNVYLGHVDNHDVIGFIDASHVYFAVEPEGLTDDEIVALVATIHCPNLCSPRANSESVIRRRQLVREMIRRFGH